MQTSRAESSKGAFYHHFRDKAAVLEALLAEFEEEGVRRAKESDRRPRPRSTSSTGYCSAAWQPAKCDRCRRPA